MHPNYFFRYAYIWRRIGAFVIDYLVAIILSLVIALSITFLSIVGLHFKGESTADFVVNQYPVIIGTYVTIAVLIIYNSLMDSSKRQATLGKTVFKLKTVDMNHKRLSLWRALLKYTIMWLIPSLILGRPYVFMLIFIMAIPIAFTSRKQGVYDIVAGSLVINREVADNVITNQDIF